MRKTKLKITRALVHGVRKFCVTLPKQGPGRNRKFFDDLASAKAFLDLIKVQLENQGTAALSISDAMRVEAIHAAELLAPFGKSLRDAATFYIAHLKTTAASRKVAEVVSDFRAARAADGMAPRTLADFRWRLTKFAESFGEELIADLSAGQIDDWLRSVCTSAGSRNTFRRRLGTFFSFARKRGWLASNPVADVEKVKERPEETEIFTCAQVSRLLEASGSETLPYWAIGAFAGLRSAEIERLDWAEIDFESCVIEVKAKNAKTASRRHVVIQPNLLAWLKPIAKARGPVCPLGLRKKLEADRERAGLSENWPQNALRHSFGSYHLALFADAAGLALQMGNSPATIFKHYRELVKPRVAKAYWNILPANETNVVEQAA